MAVAAGGWLALSSFNRHPSPSSAPSLSAISTTPSTVLDPALPGFNPTAGQVLQVAASLDAAREVLPPRQGGRVTTSQVDAVDQDGYGSSPLDPGPFLLDAVCVGYGTIQVEVDDSRGKRLAEPLVLPCYTDVGSGSAKSISFMAPGGAVTVLVHSLAIHTVAVVGFDVSPQAV